MLPPVILGVQDRDLEGLMGDGNVPGEMAESPRCSIFVSIEIIIRGKFICFEFF